MTAPQITIAGQPVPPWWAASVALVESLPDTHAGRQMAAHVLLGLMLAVPLARHSDIATVQADVLDGQPPQTAAYRLDELTDEVAD